MQSKLWHICHNGCQFHSGPSWTVKNPLFVQAFGEHLRTLRVRQGLTQHELADEADVSWSTIIRIEKGRIAATIDVLTSVARALQMPLWELLKLPEASE